MSIRSTKFDTNKLFGRFRRVWEKIKANNAESRSHQLYSETFFYCHTTILYHKIPSRSKVAKSVLARDVFNKSMFWSESFTVIDLRFSDW